MPYGALLRFGRTEVRVEAGEAEETISLEGEEPEALPRASREPHRDTLRSEGTISTRNPLADRGPVADPYARNNFV